MQSRYLLPIARTIDKLHLTGVIHRDLKPSNILIERATDAPVLTDFGLAKLIDAEQQVTLSHEAFGSPPYMAPEQVLHATSVSGSADIYSLGATLYHLLTGRPPFQADTLPEIARQIVFCDPIPPRHLDSSIPKDLETICLKCLEKDESRRYVSANDLANDLQRFLERRPIIARPIGSVGRILRWGQRNRARAAVVAGFVGLVAVMTFASTLMYVQQRISANVAHRALSDRRLSLSNDLFNKSRFTQNRNPYDSLPWLIECLRLDVGTRRELVTRKRIYSVLFHGAVFDHSYSHDGPVSCGRFNLRGDCILTGSEDGTARLWSTETGKCLQVLRHEFPVREAVFNHAGDLLATAADDGIGQIWEVKTGQKFGVPLMHPGHVSFAAFSADDQYLVTQSSDELVRIWNTRAGMSLKTVKAGETGSVVSRIDLSPRGPFGVSCCGNSGAAFGT